MMNKTSHNKVLPPTILLMALLFMLGLHFLFPVFKIIPAPWNFLGLLPVAVGIAINYLADDSFKRVRTAVNPFHKPSTLVTSGVFRISRNPMYLGFALILLGVAVLLGRLIPFGVFPLFMAWIQIHFICIEERMLENQFDQDWFEYKAKVRRWI
jgi:protein-S-isoprenylcysteine O-methyltransferase Ste14